MKHLATSIDEFEEEKFPFHIIIRMEQFHFDMLALILNEGRWQPSSEKGYWQRVDKPNFDHENLHVHVAQQKHINTKNKQVAWNDDGTRHDRSSFNDNMTGMERAKMVARNALGLPKDAYLENIDVLDQGKLLLENVENLPVKARVYIFQVTDKSLT